jgi:acetylornithine/succinyldiaminopimelate/putrescine aminotransferase
MKGPWSSDEVLAGARDDAATATEIASGNGDLVRALEIAGIAGPFRATSPWELADRDGRVRINAGGYSATPFGDRYPPLLEFVIRYLRDGDSMGLPQQSASQWRAGLEHNLVEVLASVAPSHADSQVFFSNSGAEAIECAIKFALAARPGARHFINFERGYHGKTLGALSLTPNPEYQDPFRPLALDATTLPFGNFAAFEAAVQRLGPDRIAAVVVEPVQGEAGVIVPPQDFLAAIDAVCKRHGILLVADEIQTGLGRSGYWFASIEWGGCDPDIITLAKGLGGGLVPVGATIARRAIFRKMLGGMASKRHSNTFGGNNLAMAVGLKSLEIIRDERLVERARALGARGSARLGAIAARHPAMFSAARGFGMLFAVDFEPVVPARWALGQQVMVGEMTSILGLLMWHRAGVQANLSLNSRRTVRLTPALTIPEALFDQIFDRIEAAANRHHGSWHLLTATPARTLYALGKFALRD